ncbi:hypothetical protein BV25DRAFT_1832337 [Artomyces pyxidatus]|uniref:Uncharacterized protein n=1 Tax=Artomyces pyxidatus TaxID=48021 RepID=A0ACB8SJA6_9AGAM|nr:hypothetical protein BV25DRAFT_1832337 [Artomyces pyxidatus]
MRTRLRSKVTLPRHSQRSSEQCPLAGFPPDEAASLDTLLSVEFPLPSLKFMDSPHVDLASSKSPSSSSGPTSPPRSRAPSLATSTRPSHPP